MQKILHKLIPIYLILNILYVMIGSFLFISEKIEYKIFSYGYIALLVVNIIIILFSFIMKKYKKNKLDIFLLLIIIFAIISCIFAYNPMKALFGQTNRCEGLLTICYYMTILYISSYVKKEDKIKVIYFILLVGLIELMYAFCQRLSLYAVYTMYSENQELATGFTSNPNFFGTLMLICLSYSIGLFYKSNDKLRNLILIILSYLFFMGLLISNALSSMIGIIFILIALLIYSIKNKHIKKYIILIFVMLFAFIFMKAINLTTLFDDIVKTKNETINITKGNFDDNYGTGRLYVWRRTIKVIPKYIIHGVGVDNFIHIINGKGIKRGVDHHFIYDKAHNEYLQILVTMGIFSLISYLGLHFLILKEGLKNKEIYLILPVIGYLVQAQFNISVIEVAPLFYIALGLIIDRN